MSARNFSFHLLGRPSVAEYMGAKSEVDFRIKQATVWPNNWAEFSGFLFVRQPWDGLQVLDLYCGWNKKHFLEDNEEKNYFIVSALNSCCGWLKKSGSKTLWLVGAEKASYLY